MKNLIFSIISTLFSLITAPTQAQFATTFRPLAWHHAPTSIAEYSGNYYVAGSGRNSQNGITKDVMYLSTFDANGYITYQYFSDSSNTTTNIIRHCNAMEANSNGFVMAGDSDGYFYVMKLDQSYSQIWSYVGIFGDAATEIITTGFGYLVAGDSGSVALDGNGNLIWQTTDLRYDIAQTTNGFVSCQRSDTVQLSGTDLSGNNPWSVTTGIQLVPQSWRAPHIATTANNVYVAGQKSDSLIVVSTDEYGSLQWQKSFPGSLFTVNELHTCPMGGLIITGAHMDSAFVMRLDYSGNVLWWYNRMLTDTFMSGCDAIQTTNGDIFWAGVQTNSFDLLGENFAILQVDSISLSIEEFISVKSQGTDERYDLLGKKIMDRDYEGICIINGKLKYVNR